MLERIGVNLTLREDRPVPEIVEFVQRLEGAGYDSVWVGESWGRELFVMLTALACNTSRIQIAAGIANVYSRTPALVAQCAATLDDISGKRAILGLGTSGAKVIRDWHGVPYDRPMQRTREYIEIVRLALSGQRVNYDGEIYKLRDFRIATKPARPDTPIFVASLGPKNVRLTGELADGWAPLYVSPNYLPQLQAWLAEGATRAGRDASEVDLRPYIVACVDDDPQVARRLIKGHLAFYIGGMGRYYRDLIARYGYAEETDRIADLWSKRERAQAADVVTDAMVDEICAGGTAEQARQKLADLADKGLDSPVLYVPNGSPMETMLRTVDELAPAKFR